MESTKKTLFRKLEHRPEEGRFAGMMAILYTVLVALDHEKAEQITAVFQEKLGTYPISEPISAAYLREIVVEAMAE